MPRAGQQQYAPQQYAPPQQHQQAYASPPAQKRRRVWPWVLLAVILVPVLGFVGCAAMVGGAVSAVSGAPATVVYELVGDGDSATSVTYSVGAAAGMAQESKATLPWRKEVPFAEGALRVATLTAQNAGDGALTCRITVDGQVVREVTSTGQYAVVTCASEAF